MPLRCWSAVLADISMLGWCAAYPVGGLMTEATPFPSDAHPRLAARKRIWSKACLMISFNIRFRETELPLQEARRGCGPAPQCRPVAQSNAQDRILQTVDRIDSRYRSRLTVYSQIDSHDAVAIAVDPCELIKAR